MEKDNNKIKNLKDKAGGIIRSWLDFLLDRRNRKKIIYIALAVVLVIVILFSNYLYKQNKRDKSLQSKGMPLHSCGVGGFSKEVKRGQSASFEVVLEASRFWRQYKVRMGNLPKGVSAEVDDYKGRGDGKAKIDISVGDNASPASYSLVIVYEEEQSGDYEPTYCQFNLIVE
ncbi:hypothetical protein DRH27_03130 [Candidatus Falkowbacteria bacterium]|nr:MAG: hypothetical protein DRH27_03130 [Candidatus Falkowbacteria bacterium]